VGVRVEKKGSGERGKGEINRARFGGGLKGADRAVKNRKKKKTHPPPPRKALTKN